MSNEQNSLSPRARRSTLFLVFSFFFLPFILAAETLEDSTRALAAEVAAIPNLHGPLLVTWENHSSLSNRQSEALRAQFQAQLAALHLPVTDDASAPPLRVAIGETPTTYLFVATVHVGDSGQVRFVQRSRGTAFLPGSSPSPRRLVKELLWEQPSPILGAIERVGTPQSPAEILILDRESVALYRFGNAVWTLSSTAPIVPPVSPTRDLRGRIHFTPEASAEFFVEAPGVICYGNLTDQVVMDCKPANGRDRIENNASALSMYLQEAVPLRGSSCDGLPSELSSDQGDWTVPDYLLLRNTNSPSSSVEVSLDMPGPVFSLSSVSGETECIVVTFNLITGNYEVYRVTLSCGG